MTYKISKTNGYTREDVAAFDGMVDAILFCEARKADRVRYIMTVPKEQRSIVREWLNYFGLDTQVISW